MPEIVHLRPPVCDGDLQNLRASDITDSTIWENSLRTENGALAFPYRDIDGTLNCFARYRLHVPRMTDGKLTKYLQPKDSPLRAYFPVASLPKLRDGQSPIHITEGEKKTLALSQLGFAAVGIGGIWGGCKQGEDGEHRLIDDLQAINWQDRVVYIVFDYDPKAATRREAEAARQRLARALRAAGAVDVFNIELPPDPDGAKNGVDDFLVLSSIAPNTQDSAASAFSQLVERAIPVIKVITYGTASGNPVIKIIPPPLDPAAYHGPIGDFLRAVEPHTEATGAGILAHLLPAIGTLIGPDVHTFAGTEQPARLNTVLVGPTSTGRKGTALAPVDELMRQVAPILWQEQRVGGLSTGEGLVAKVADIRTWNDDTQTYDIEYVEKRLYVVEQEFSRVLAQLRRDGNILSQILRESFDSGNLAVMTRGNPLQAMGAHISITGHITPEELHDRLNHIEMANGFGNRFLWFVVKSDKVLPRCRPLPETVFTSFAERLRQLANEQAGYVPLADASMGAWEQEIYPALRQDRPGFAGAMLARGSAIVLRVALLYSLLDPPPTGGSREIAPAHLDAAMAVWNYCEQSVRTLFGTRGRSALENKLYELLAGGPLTKDQINDHLSPGQKAEAGAALANLEAASVIRKVQVKRAGPGRPPTVWQRA